jgi:hypothetical protein
VSKTNKITIGLIAILLSTSAMADDNLIFIDQIGSSSDVTVEQPMVRLQQAIELLCQDQTRPSA